jgi:hypothetical protein
VSDDSSSRPSDSGDPVFDEAFLSDARRAELAPKLRILLADLVQIRELERPESEPATPWPWRADDGGR